MFDSLEEFDRRLLCFVASWAPFGGPPAEEILPRFGISSAQVGQRICEVADQYREARICFQDQAVITRALAWVEHSGGICPD